MGKILQKNEVYMSGYFLMGPCLRQVPFPLTESLRPSIVTVIGFLIGSKMMNSRTPVRREDREHEHV